MKKFILKVLLFFALVVVMDFAWGGVFSWLRSHAKGGSTAKCEYIANHCEDDIIVFGSSRAIHHYIPSLISDSLEMSCYNCGEDGNGIVLAYGRYKQIISRHKPKLIIYEVTPVFDYLDFEDNSKYIGLLRPYYQQKVIKPIINEFGDELISLKMKSKQYQNTERLLPNIYDNIFSRNNNNGYLPLYGKLNSFPSQNTNDEDNKEIDYNKFKLIEKMILDTQKEGVPICFVVSPKCNYSCPDTKLYTPIMELCDFYNTPFFNYIYLDGISNNPSLFQDAGHLNDEGAKIYSSLFIKEIKKILKK